MKVIAYCPLHYGGEYLAAAIQSVENHVDKIMIFYTETPSYGFNTKLSCPETEEELFKIATEASPKVEWFKVQSGSEGEHRHLIYQFTEGYDLVLAFDFDEVFDQQDLARVLKEAFANKEHLHFGLSGFINFWRSFNNACYDGFTPVRITNLHNTGAMGILNCKVYHFSCAQSARIMNYKYAIHGHKDEIREGWLEQTYFGWHGQPDLHPVSIGLWNATPFDKTTLPESLKNHANYNKEII